MRCAATKTDGSPCQAEAHPGFDHCAFHRPDLKRQRAEGRRRGGKARNRPAATLPPDVEPLPFGTIEDVRHALAATFNDVRTGRVDCRVGNCLAVLGAGILRAIEGGDVERRLDALEAAARAQEVPA